MRRVNESSEVKKGVPEFLTKLWHILEQQEYNEFVAWHGEDEIVIKNRKKLQEKVLPQFFRHKRMPSFVRQLNMYHFNKVSKVTRDKNHMYFHNDFFRRDRIDQLGLIHRKSKHTQDQERDHEHSLSCDISCTPSAHPNLKIVNQLDSWIEVVRPSLTSEQYSKGKELCNKLLHFSVQKAHSTRIIEDQFNDRPNNILATYRSFRSFEIPQPPSSKSFFNQIR